MMLLEHSALGGSGSRGYGQIKFHMLDPVVFKKSDYVLDAKTTQKSLSAIPQGDETLENDFKSLSALQFNSALEEIKTN